MFTMLSRRLLESSKWGKLRSCYVDLPPGSRK